MPDFERVTRKLRLHMAKTESQKNQVRAYHKGLDQARIEILVIVCAVAVIALIVDVLN